MAPPLPYSTFDPDADALYFYLSHRQIEETVQVVEGQLMLDLDSLGEPVGVEILGPNFPHHYGKWEWLERLSDYQIRFIANVVRQHHRRADLGDHPGNLANQLLAVIVG